jgi:predicted CxxxxCH...CXXCH cytochrome family protein
VTTSPGRFPGSPYTAAGCAILALAACGGGGVSDPPLTGSQALAFAYFETCVNPIFVTPLQVMVGGTTTTKTCAAAACHASATGAGGAFRIIPTAAAVDLSNPANTPAVIRTTDMYKNFTSAQGETVKGSPTQSLLLNKPLVNNVFHGGGVVFASSADPNARRIEYWIGNPVPQGQDEFSTATYSTMFNPPFNPSNPNPSACNSN